MILLQKRRKTFLTTTKTNTAIKILGIIGLGFSLSTFQAHAQANVENNIGFHAAASVYQDFELNIPDHYYFGTNLEIGFDFTHYYDRSSFWKTGVNYTFFRSPYENDISYYDEYLRVPFFFSVSKLREFKHNNDLYLTLGPQVSILTRQGKIHRGQGYYNFDKSIFAGAIKIGLTGEIAFYQRMIHYAHSGGFRFSLDLPKMLIRPQGNLLIYDQYVTGTLFYGISKRKRRGRLQ